MKHLMILAVFIALTSGVPQKKVDPAKDIKFDDPEPEDEARHEVEEDRHFSEAGQHKNHHQRNLDHISHHLAQYEHNLLHRAQALAEREDVLAQREQALTQHLLAPTPVAPHGKQTYLLVSLPQSAVIPVKPGALYDPHVKKHLFTTGHH
ncbi:uncharacterized protein LOC128990632 [Macrosteles quadrilineatus]|uniref:uncharacterized protein LOC128990632 n=1 Tax=Macrosteles quadrilineatus TaxID=74068 RepID=UPI0023E17DBE|nr:uncharacterized protein LOC128990632 [Macrosteles quadrilineatus]